MPTERPGIHRQGERMMKMRKRRGASGRAQRGMATILIILIMALAVAVTVLWVASSLRNTQQRQLTAHAATAAQGAAWRGVEVIRVYLKQVPEAKLAQWGASKSAKAASTDPVAKTASAAKATTVSCRDYPEGLAIEGLASLGVVGKLTRVCAADSDGVFRITARVTGKAGAGTATTTSTVEVVYDVTPGGGSTGEPTDGTGTRLPVPVASFTGTLNYDGSTLDIVNGKTATDIAVDGTINFNGAAQFSACSTKDINFTSNQYCGIYYRAEGAMTGRGATFGKYGGGACSAGTVEGVMLHAGTGIDLSRGGSNSNGRFWTVQTAAGDIRILGTSEFVSPTASLWSGGAIALGSAGSGTRPIGELLSVADVTMGAGNQLSTIERATIGGSLYIDSWNNRIDAGSIAGSVVVRNGNQSLVKLTAGGKAPKAPVAPECEVPVPSIDVSALRGAANMILDFGNGDRSQPVLQVQNMTPLSMNRTYDLTSGSSAVRTQVAAFFGCDADWCRSQAIPTYDRNSDTWRLPAFGSLLPGVIWVNGSLNIQPNSGYTFYNTFVVTQNITLSNNGFVIKAPNFAPADGDVCRANANPLNLCDESLKRRGVSLGNMAMVIANNATLSGNTIHGHVVIGNSLSGTSGSIRVNGRLMVGSNAGSEINFAGGGFHMTVDSSGMTEDQTEIETGGDPGTGTKPTTSASSRVRWSRYL